MYFDGLPDWLKWGMFGVSAITVAFLTVLLIVAIVGMALSRRRRRQEGAERRRQWDNATKAANEHYEAVRAYRRAAGKRVLVVELHTTGKRH